MKSNRREFLKQTGVAGAAVVAAGCSVSGTVHIADPAPRRAEGGPMPSVISGYPKERQVWLKPGDKLETTIGNLGTLRFSLT